MVANSAPRRTVEKPAEAKSEAEEAARKENKPLADLEMATEEEANQDADRRKDRRPVEEEANQDADRQ